MPPGCESCEKIDAFSFMNAVGYELLRTMSLLSGLDYDPPWYFLIYFLLVYAAI